MKLRINWRGYGYCYNCKVHEQESCRGWRRFFPCKNRESYDHFLERYALILSEHYGYTILPHEVEHYVTGGI